MIMIMLILVFGLQLQENWIISNAITVHLGNNGEDYK